MERLTFRVSDDVARLICRIEEGACVGKTYTCPDTTPGCPEIQKVLYKLAAYEDTGLEPQTISEILDSVSEWYDAHKEGRLPVLPCAAAGTPAEGGTP